MSNQVTVNLFRPVASAVVIDGRDLAPGAQELESDPHDSLPDTGESLQQHARGGATSDEPPEMLVQVCQSLRSAAAELSEVRDALFVEHKDQIAKLSVEIARKILLQKVEDGNYEIESIVKEALTNAPSRHDIVAHLSPEDYTPFRETLPNGQEGLDGTFAGVKFVPDPNIGRAECLLETPKGIVKSLIDESLERVSQALQRTH
ncbi:MAG: FliH/SctL family protein [Sedimentisphaerales bacterium]